MRISDWSSDVCSSDLLLGFFHILLSEALIMTTQMRANPLATPAQITAEKEALRIAALPEMQAMRETLRQMMLADPGAQSIAGRQATARVLDQCVRGNIFMHITMAQKAPTSLGIAENPPR